MTFFPNFEKKIQIFKKTTFFFVEDCEVLMVEEMDFIQSTLHGDILLLFNGNSMCNSFFVFLLTKMDIIVHYNKFPNLVVCRANFPNLRGPRALPRN